MRYRLPPGRAVLRRYVDPTKSDGLAQVQGMKYTDRTYSVIGVRAHDEPLTSAVHTMLDRDNVAGLIIRRQIKSK